MDKTVGHPFNNQSPIVPFLLILQFADVKVEKFSSEK